MTSIEIEIPDLIYQILTAHLKDNRDDINKFVTKAIANQITNQLVPLKAEAIKAQPKRRTKRYG